MKENKNIHIEGDNRGVAITGDGNTVNFPKHIIPKILTNQTGLANDIYFVGRKEELQKVDELLNQNSILLLYGMGGIGKSTLGSYYRTYYLNQKRDDFDYYGFIQVNDNIKLSFASAFKTSFNLESEKIDDLFIKIMNKLQNLEGGKLLIIDDIKDTVNQKNEINEIITLKNNNFKILFTSREDILRIPKKNKVFLEHMNKDDSRDLFLRYFPTDEIDKVDQIIDKYLDYHTLFIEMTAKTLDIKKRTLSLNQLIDKFENQDFSKIKRDDIESYYKFLDNFSSNDMIVEDEDNLLFIKRLSVLPSIKISFDDLYKFLVCKNEDTLDEFLIKLVRNGWIIESKDGYKFHQILRDYILEKYRPKFEDIEKTFIYFSKLIENSSDINIAISNRDYLIYFESIHQIIKDCENFEVILFYMRIGSIYRQLSLYKKALFFAKLSNKKMNNLLNNIDKQMMSKKDWIWVSHIYNNLSQAYYSLGLYKRTLVLDKKVLSIREEVLGQGHILTIRSYHNLADLYFRCGNIPKAKELYKIFLEFMDNSDEKNADNIYMYSNYASFLIKTEPHNRKSLEYNKEVVISFLKKYDNTNPDIGTFYYNLAYNYEHFSEYQLAEDNYKKALNIKIKFLGKQHSDVATAYMALAVFYSNNIGCDIAFSYIDKALEIYMAIFQTEEHPDIALCYDNLGSIYNRCQKYDEANDFSLKALALYERLLGTVHYTTAKSYHNVAISFYLIEKFEKANQYIKKAIEIGKKTLPEKHPYLIESEKGLKMIKEKLKEDK